MKFPLHPPECPLRFANLRRVAINVFTIASAAIITVGFPIFRSQDEALTLIRSDAAPIVALDVSYFTRDLG